MARSRTPLGTAAWTRVVACALTAAGMLLVPACAPDPPVPIGDTVRLVRVASGLTSPVDFAEPDDGSGRLFVVDQVGVIYLLDGAGGLVDPPFLDLRSQVVDLTPSYDERGLLGLVFHPQYAENGRLFVVYNAPGGDDLPAGYDSELRLSEFTAEPPDADTVELATERILLRVAKPQFNHNGGQVAFGPDGMLYLSIGDGGGANDEGLGHTPGSGNGQDLSKLLGKILRLNVDINIPIINGTEYDIPADNPFVGEDGARPEIWAYGFRNPWRFAFDQGGDHRLFVADAGQDLFEEVSIVEEGGNYGWRIREGAACFDPDNPDTPPATCPDTATNGDPLVDPILQFEHTTPAGVPVGTVVIGGYVYRGTALPDLVGAYIFGDFTTVQIVPNGQLYVAREEEDGTWTRTRLGISGSPSGLDRYVLAFGQDLAGEVYVLVTSNLGPTGSTGEVYRLAAPP